MHHGRAVRQWIVPVWLLRLRRWQEDESGQLPPRVSPAVQVLGCVQDLAQQRAVGGRTQVCAMPWSSPSYMPACPTVCVHVPSEVALRCSRCYHLCPHPSLHVRMPACTGSWLYVRTLVGAPSAQGSTLRSESAKVETVACAIVSTRCLRARVQTAWLTSAICTQH